MMTKDKSVAGGAKKLSTFDDDDVRIGIRKAPPPPPTSVIWSDRVIHLLLCATEQSIWNWKKSNLDRKD